MRPRRARAGGTPAARLALTRLAVGGYAVFYLAAERSLLRRVARTDPRLFAPVGPVRALRRPLPPPVVDRISDATLAGAALFTLGVRHRWVGPAYSALLNWTLSYRNSWSMIYHVDNLLVAHTTVLAFSPAADAVAVGAPAVPPPADPRYGRPLAVLRAASTIPYLLAGVAKLAQPDGLTWARGDAMRRQVAIDGIRKVLYGNQVRPAAHLLYPHPRLFTAAAVGTLVLELGAPLAIGSGRVGRVWAAATYGMHWAVHAVMGIPFRYQLSGVSFAPWLELERLLPGRRRR